MTDDVVQYSIPQTSIPFDPSESSTPTPHNGRETCTYSASITVDFTTQQATGSITVDGMTSTEIALEPGAPVDGAYTYLSGGNAIFFLDSVTPSTIADVQVIEPYVIHGPLLEDDRYQAMDEPITSTVVACFAQGTLIRLATGWTPVERLAVGDLVVTASGEHRPIRWLGHRTIDCRRHPRPEDAMPVRVAAHAFDDHRPARDLLVSPGHAICVDDVLIPASCLLNGTTLAQVAVAAVTYWHVELDDHDIILAENLPSESYIAVGNRSFFVEADATALRAAPDGPAKGLADYCRPFHDHGPAVEVVRARLAARAATLPPVGSPLRSLVA